MAVLNPYDLLQAAKQGAGNLVEQVGTRLNLPEGRISERIAGSWTPLTNVTPQSQAVYGGNPAPYRNTSIASTQSNYPLYTSTGARTQPSGGGTGFAAPTPKPSPEPQQQQPSAPSYEDQVRGQIEGAYGDYFRGLDEMMAGLNPQATAQQGLVQNQYQQGLNTLTGQRDVSNRLLGTQRTNAEASQKKNLLDMYENIRNLFQSGQSRLGALGAGDSSAANQYSYALTKMGNKSRGDITAQTAGIMNDIADREFQVQNTFNTESNNLALERDSRLNEIASWLSDAQNQIRQMKATGQLQKGQDLAGLSTQLLNNAMNMANQVRAEAANKQAMLEQWAANNSANVGQLAQNMAGISNINYNLPTFQGLNPNMAYQGGATRTTYGGGLFGNREEDRLR